MSEAEDQLVQWREAMAIESKQLNKKVDIIIQGLVLLTPPPPSPVVVTNRPQEVASTRGTSLTSHTLCYNVCFVVVL